MALKTKTYTRIVKPDHDREVFTVLRMVRESGESDKEICEQAGISPTTLKKWRLGYQNGGTRYPTGINLALVAQAAGYVKVWVPTGTQSLKDAVPFADEEPTAGKKRSRSKGAQKPAVSDNVIQLPKPIKSKNKAVRRISAAV